jgi:hypothetical protein
LVSAIHNNAIAPRRCSHFQPKSEHLCSPIATKNKFLSPAQIDCHGFATRRAFADGLMLWNERENNAPVSHPTEDENNVEHVAGARRFFLNTAEHSCGLRRQLKF